MSMEDLRTRLDEDEATARHSGPAKVAWLTLRDKAGQMRYTTVAAGGQGDWDSWCADGKEIPEPASVRVVYDPAREIRKVEAVRAILAEYERDPQADDRYLDGLAFALERLADAYRA